MRNDVKLVTSQMWLTPVSMLSRGSICYRLSLFVCCSDIPSNCRSFLDVGRQMVQLCAVFSFLNESVFQHNLSSVLLAVLVL
jgi:hypothetical protein